jgi:hypothetical protein
MPAGQSTCGADSFQNSFKKGSPPPSRLSFGSAYCFVACNDSCHRATHRLVEDLTSASIRVGIQFVPDYVFEFVGFHPFPVPVGKHYDEATVPSDEGNRNPLPVFVTSGYVGFPQDGNLARPRCLEALLMVGAIRFQILQPGRWAFMVIAKLDIHANHVPERVTVLPNLVVNHPVHLLHAPETRSAAEPKHGQHGPGYNKAMGASRCD